MISPVTVHLARASGDAHEALRALVAAVLGAHDVRLARGCGACGSAQHGRPVAFADGNEVAVSLARPVAAGPAIVAVCRESAVGVDVEAEGGADFEGFDDVVAHPCEQITPTARTRTWVRKEALLKALGTGLTTDPKTVALTADGCVLAGPSGTVADVDAGPGWVCAVAVMPPRDIQIVWH